MFRRFALFMPLMILASVAHAETPDTTRASNAEWRRGIDDLVRDIKAHHPDPFTKCGELTFLRRAEALEAALPGLPDEAKMVGAMRLVALVGDGHTSAEPRGPRFALWYPLRIYQFTDGYFVTGAHKSVSDLAGAQILQIAGHPVAEVAQAARELMGSDNEYDAREHLFPIHSAALMKGLGYAGAAGELKIQAKLANGKVVERTLTPMPGDMPNYGPGDASFDWRFRPEMFGPPVGVNEDWISAFRNLPALAFRQRDSLRPPHLVFRRPLSSVALPQHDAYYIQTNGVSDNPNESFLAFFRRCLHEVDAQKPRRLIVDIRYNFGGDGSMIPSVIQEFVARQADPPWKELYLVTGRRTFSAGVMLLNAFLANLSPTLIGEPAGAALNSYGDADGYDHPRLGLHVSISHQRHELAQSTDLSAFVPVDVPASFSFADYAAGRDPAVDPILRGEEMRSIATIALASGADAARTTWQARRAKFANDRSWAPPTEIQLREVARIQIDRGDTTAAIATARLNTEIHPTEWRTWFNLGRYQRMVGQMAEGSESYRRCLALDDPTNFNAAELRKVVAAAGQKSP